MIGVIILVTDRLRRTENIMIMILMMDLCKCVCVSEFSGRCLTSHWVSQPEAICSASTLRKSYTYTQTHRGMMRTSVTTGRTKQTHEYPHARRCLHAKTNADKKKELSVQEDMHTQTDRHTHTHTYTQTHTITLPDGW